MSEGCGGRRWERRTSGGLCVAWVHRWRQPKSTLIPGSWISPFQIKITFRISCKLTRSQGYCDNEQRTTRYTTAAVSFKCGAYLPYRAVKGDRISYSGGWPHSRGHIQLNKQNAGFSSMCKNAKWRSPAWCKNAKPVCKDHLKSLFPLLRSRMLHYLCQICMEWDGEES